MPSAKAKPKRKPLNRAEYAKKKRVNNARARRLSKEAREVGPIPRVTNKPRRARCAESLREFCLTYFAAKFYLPFAPDHLRVIDRLERIVRRGGLLALAMPRGSGKTELVKAAALWSILYGYRKFVVIIGATDADAERIIDDLKSSLSGNDTLAEDFPEACHCIRELEGITHRAKGQLLNGEPSRLVWKQNQIRLSAVPGARCSGAVIRTAGLTGSIRGMSATAPDGGSMRPDLVIPDDPQTRESAASPTQTAGRERIIRGDVLGLAGPTRTIACCMPLTVIYPNDLADRFLDREKNPQWNGERTRLVHEFPANVELWDRYFDIRGNSLRGGSDGHEATEFYRQHRGEMDAGAAVAWPERFDSARYLSAIEEAMNRRHDDPAEFAAEYQNQPLADAGPATCKELRAVDVAAKLNRVLRGEVPREATRLTAMIDLGTALHWYCVCAWDERFGGAVVDYGAFPPQNRNYFLASDARPSLSDRFPGMSEPQRVYAGLAALTDQILGRSYRRQETCEPVKVERCLIDSGWLGDVVFQFVRQSQHAAILLPSKGYSSASSAKSMDDWATRPGERVGHGWRLGLPASGRGRLLTFDPDVWKTFVADRLLTLPGGAGCLQLFGEDPGAHALFADHCCAEYAFRVTVKGRTFDRWEVRPSRPENHAFDTLVGATVAANVLGVAWSSSGQPIAPKPPRPRVKLSDLYRQKHGNGGWTR